MFKLKKVNDKWEIISHNSITPQKAEIFEGVYPGRQTPYFNSKKEAKKWLKMYVGLLV